MADRILKSLDRLRQELPQVFERQWFATGRNGDRPLTELTLEALTAHVAAANTEGDEKYVGFTTSISAAAESGRPEVTVDISAGGAGGFVGNRFVTTVREAADGGLASWISLLPDALLAQSEEWDTDRGDLSDTACGRAVRRAQGLKNSDPRAGYATYLSPRRYQLVSPDLPARRLPARDGSAVLSLLHEGGELPTADEIIQFDSALRASGALAALPTPMDRARL